MDIPPQSGILPLCFFLLVGLSVKLYLNANFISIGVKINTIEKDKIVASKYFINFLLKI